MLPASEDRLALLVNRRKRLTIFAEVAPPRLFIAAQQMADQDREQRQRQPISDEEAGQLIGGDGNWACLDVASAVRYLVDAWCERRCLGPLGRVLLAWPATGSTDGAHALLGAVRLARAAGVDVCTPFELELSSAVESKLSRQLPGE